MTIRMATVADAEALLHIYSQYINTCITFEYELPTPAAFAKRIADVLQQYPYLVCQREGRITGYAYAHRLQERAAYQWNAELSVYLDPTCTGRGDGTKLYRTLIRILQEQGVKTVYGIVASPNARSERLHEGLGFQKIGTQHCTGYKNGCWLDVNWFEKQIALYETAPAPVRSVHSLSTDRLGELLSSENQDNA